MASLTANFNVGTGSASALVKSAATLANSLATYQDDEEKIAYENSGYTDAAFASYQSYLNSRITTLSSSGTIADQTKALTMQQELTTAQHSNISYHIQQDNINLMSSGISGTAAGYYQKMQVLQSQYQTAVGIGDVTLADSLMSQYYSASQSYQSALSTASSSAATASKAAATANITNQNEIVTNLKGSLTALNDSIKAGGSMTSAVNAFVKVNDPVLKALGVVLPQNASPNYWNIVNGVVGAQYNAEVTLSNMYSATDPQLSLTHQENATALYNGETTVSTLAGSLNAQQIAQAEVDPSMFTTNISTGKMTMNQKTGLGFAGSNQGQFAGSLENTYSGDNTKTLFLSPLQTNMMTKMGLEFSESKSAPKTAQSNAVQTQLGITNPNAIKSEGTSTETATNGVTATITSSSPNWLKKLAAEQVQGSNSGTGVELNMFLDQQVGNGKYLEFGHAGSGANAYYIVASDGKGLTGGFRIMQNQDGTMNIESMGGQYGFDQTSVYNTINSSLNNQLATVLANNLNKQSITQSKPLPMPKLETAPATPAKITSTTTSTAPPAAVAVGAPKANALQPTVPGTNIQSATGSGYGSGSAGIALGSSGSNNASEKL